jgi:hypothetical protein
MAFKNCKTLSNVIEYPQEISATPSSDKDLTVASISYTLNQDIYVLLDFYKENQDFEAMFLMNQAIDRSDQISKLHLTTPEFFSRLESTIQVIAEVESYSSEMPALKELLEIVGEHRTRYCTNL